MTPDDKTFVEISKLYAKRHTNMHQGKGLCYEDDFPEGITNGAKWYIVKGGMQVIIIVLYKPSILLALVNIFIIYFKRLTFNDQRPKSN